MMLDTVSPFRINRRFTLIVYPCPTATLCVRIPTQPRWCCFSCFWVSLLQLLFSISLALSFSLLLSSSSYKYVTVSRKVRPRIVVSLYGNWCCPCSDDTVPGNEDTADGMAILYSVSDSMIPQIWIVIWVGSVWWKVWTGLAFEAALHKNLPRINSKRQYVVCCWRRTQSREPNARQYHAAGVVSRRVIPSLVYFIRRLYYTT